MQFWSERVRPRQQSTCDMSSSLLSDKTTTESLLVNRAPSQFSSPCGCAVKVALVLQLVKS
eukprot:2373395-Amphidinium_carterae.1